MNVDDEAVQSDGDDEATPGEFLLTGVLLVVGGIVVYLSWPISPLLLLSLAAWWFTSAGSANPWGKALTGFFGPVTGGLALLSFLLLLVNLLLLAFALDPAKSALLANGVWRVEHSLRSFEALLGKWHSLGLWTFPAIMLTLIVLNSFLARWRLVARFLAVQKLLSATFLALIVVTSFTLFGKPVIGDVADDASAEWKNRARPYLKPIAGELAGEALARAVDEASPEDREDLARDFQDIRDRVDSELPYLPLIEAQRQGSLSAPDAFREAQKIVERTLTENPNTYRAQRKTKEQRRAELEVEAKGILDGPEEYVKRSRSLEAALSNYLAEEHVLRTIKDSRPFQEFLSSVDGSNRTNEIRTSESAGFKYAASQLLEGMLPGSSPGAEAIHRIGDAFLTKVAEGTAQPLLDRLADEAFRLKLRVGEGMARLVAVEGIRARVRSSLGDARVAAATLSSSVWTSAGALESKDRVETRAERREVVRNVLDSALVRTTSGGEQVDRIEALFEGRSETLRRRFLRGRPGIRARR